MDIILIKYAEIGLKGKNRAAFEKRLVENIAAAARVPRSRIARERGRIIVTPEGNTGRILRELSYVFGIHSFTPALQVVAAEKEIAEACISLYQARANTTPARAAQTFAVNARRAVKQFPLSSQALNANVGEAVETRFPGLSVDLNAPDHIFNIEVHKEHAFVYVGEEEARGPGGLPVGASGKALLMLSGGIDSPVAGWHLLKRGLALDAVYFHSFPFTGDKSKEKVFDLARVLSRWAACPLVLHVPSLADIQTHIAHNAPEEYMTVLFRRSMQRIAARIAEARGCGALVTGESVAQVASQTLANMHTIETASDQTVLRPLVGFDKQEIISIAERIGTYEISIQPYEDCCTVFTPNAPKTKTIPAKVEAIEGKLELEELEERSAAEREVWQVDADSIERNE